MRLNALLGIEISNNWLHLLALFFTSYTMAIRDGYSYLKLRDVIVGKRVSTLHNVMSIPEGHCFERGMWRFVLQISGVKCVLISLHCKLNAISTPLVA